MRNGIEIGLIHDLRLTPTFAHIQNEGGRNGQGEKHLGADPGGPTKKL